MQPLLHLLLDFLVILALTGLLLSRLVDLMLRRAAPKQTKWLAFTFPFALIAYFSICFALISAWLPSPHRSQWDVTLTGNYHLFLIKDDSAAIYDASVPGVFDHGAVLQLPGHPEIIFGVHTLEVRPPFIFGFATPTAYDHAAQSYDKPLYFLLDTRTGTRTDEPSMDALKNDAVRLGGWPPMFGTVKAAYRHYRVPLVHSHFYLLSCIPPLIFLYFAIRTLLRMRALPPPSPDQLSHSTHRPIG